MRIRCERCATTYELDEKKLPPHGGMVKCTRCQHVFRAAPPGLAGPAPVQPAAPPSPPRPVGTPGNGVDAAAVEKTAVFGFSAGGDPEGTASLGSAAPAVAPPPGEEKAVRVPGGAQGSGATSGGRRWVWLAVGVAVAVAAGLLFFR